jgi:hypothetical protein
VGAFVALCVWALGVAPAGSTGDSGVKQAQAHALWTHGTRSLADNSDVDPQNSHYPYGVEFVRTLDTGERQGIYSITFVALLAPVAGMLGRGAQPLVPLLGMVLVICGLVLLSRRLALSSVATSGLVLLVLGATPFVVYAFEPMEHTLAAGFAVLALAFALPDADGPTTGVGRPLRAGLLMGAAATFRPELYCGVAILGVVLVAPSLRRPMDAIAISWRYLAAALLVLVPFWVINWLTAGTWDPVVTINAGREPTLAGAGRMLLAESRTITGGLALAPLAVCAAVALARVWLPRRAGLILHICAGVAVSALAVYLQETSRARVLTGLLVVAPLAYWAACALPATRAGRMLWAFALLDIALVVALDRSGTAGGLQSGPRYLLPALPMLLLLAVVSARAAYQASEHAVLRVAVVAVGLGLLAVGVRGVYCENSVRAYVEIAEQSETALERVLALEPRTVVTQRYWESRVLAPATVQGRRLFTTQGPIGLALLERFARAGIDRFVYVSSKPIDLPLQDGRRARTVKQLPGWMPLQEVRIQ